VCNRETSLLAARNELVAHKTRKLNMSIRTEMRHLDQLGLPLSINFRLNSPRRDSSVTGSEFATGIRPIGGPDRHYVPSIHAAARAKIDIDPHRLPGGIE
jgi:hypothetical protein